MSEMVERVAKTLQEIDFTVGKPNYFQAARAVIEAMREPTEAMWKAEQPTWSLGRPMWDWWRAMIDEALK
jgi:hypothetical protein